MSEIREPIGRLHLVGYEKLTNHGLALPVFGQSLGANVFYTARSSSPGEADGHITGFDLYDPDGLVGLPPEQIRETRVGDPWLDIFLWEGEAYVGTAQQIWNGIAEVRGSIAEQAPLSLLALAEGVERVPDPQLVQKAVSWLTRRYGRRKALEWQTATYLRGIVLKGLRRKLGAAAHNEEMRRILREELIVHQDHNQVTVTIGVPLLSFIPEVFTGDFLPAALSLGITKTNLKFVNSNPGKETDKSSTQPPRKIWNRTPEDEMRIAALRVAAGKPDGKATTTQIKNEVDRYVSLTPADRLPSKTRPNEAMYQQIVGNIVSHRQSKNSIFGMGWAIYTGNGIQITDVGRQYLNTLGLQS